MVSWLYFSGLDNCARNNISQPFGFSKQFGSSTYDCDIFSDKLEREVRRHEVNQYCCDENKSKKGGI